MSKRAPDQWRYWAETNNAIGRQLRAYYRACTTEELPPRLLVLLKKLDEETEPSAKQVEATPGVLPAKARQIAANIAKLPELLRKP